MTARRSPQEMLRHLFDNSVEVEGPYTSKCRVWEGCLSTCGYGTVRFEGRVWLVHRLMYFLSHGPIPAGLQVQHRCSVRDCLELGHLKLGIPADNNLDMALCGGGASVLTNDQVLELRELRANGASYASLAHRFKITPQYAGQTARGYARQHVGGPITERRKKTSRFSWVSKSAGKWCANIWHKGEQLSLGHYWHESEAALAINLAIQILGLNRPLNQINDEEAMTTSKMEEDRERLEVLRNDLKLRNQSAKSEASTFHDHAQADANVARGRYSAEMAQTVVGSTPIPKYPTLPSGPWSGEDPVGQEPPLGYSVSRPEQSSVFPAPALPNPAAQASPSSADAGLGSSSGRPASQVARQPTAGSSPSSQMGDAGAGRSSTFQRRL
jgi:hypothetical protein